MTNLSFKQYIIKYGDSAASQTLAISLRTCAAYRRGERRPRSKDIPRL